MLPKIFLKKMAHNDWLVGRRTIIKSDFVIDTSAESRLAKCPTEFIDFICSFQTFTNFEENIWFLSYLDFKSNKREEVFPWNDFENQSIESSSEDTRDAIKSFWSTHVPLLLSIKGQYSYIAICIDNENYGKIYQGYEPEYNKTKLTADNLADFFEKFSQQLITI